MFEGLKKKFSSFIGSISKKETEEIAGSQKEEPQTEMHAEPEAKKQPEPEAERPTNVETSQKPKEAIVEPAVTGQSRETKEWEGRHVHQVVAETQKPLEPAARPEEAKRLQHNEKLEEVVGQKPTVIQPPRNDQNEERKEPAREQMQQKQPKVTTTTKIKGLIFGKVRISEKDAEPFIEDLRLGLLQSDVNYDVSERIAQSIRAGLIGKEISSRGVEAEIRETIRGSIMGVLKKGSGADLIRMAREKQSRGELPFKIMFIGPNGAGKTTTMAKIANMLLSNNITCVLSASDTFRAAAIEQTAYHAAKLGINVIKGTYGADPASVAFDAIAHAKAHGIMAVLIDSAGRQETNRSLIEELKKMVRISRPDLKVFVGESISGNALLDQVKAINEAVGLDGIILTKLDCDAKGGNTLSILSDTEVPILFFGTGEKYTDIMSYDPQFIVDSMLPNN